MTEHENQNLASSLSATSFNNGYDFECHKLLIDLKTTVEGLLVNRSSNVWNTYGGLNRLSTHVEKILNHKLCISQGICDFWHFVSALRWLQPTSAPQINSLEKKYGSDVQMIGFQWLHHSLYNLSLSSKLKLLINDIEHLSLCYDNGAFLRQYKYACSLVICLKAVEENNPALLADIEPSLLVHQPRLQKMSFCVENPAPSSQISLESIDKLCLEETEEETKDPLMRLTVSERNGRRSLQRNVSYDSAVTNQRAKQKVFVKRRKRVKSMEEKSEVKSDEFISQIFSESKKLDPVSLDEIDVDVDEDQGDSTLYTDNLSSRTESFVPTKNIQVKKKSSHARSKSDVVKNDELMKILSSDKSDSTTLPSSLPTSLKDDQRRPSLLQDGCNSIAPKTECFFPQPFQGQSLTSFLSSQDFNTCAELDRENAHFSISEALISAIAQMKWNQSYSQFKDINEEEEEDESDEEIANLKQRIRIRRCERQIEKITCHVSSSGGCLNSSATSVTLRSSTASSHCSDLADSLDDVDELEFSDDEKNQSKLSSLNETGLSLSMASLYSSADIYKARSTNANPSSTPLLEQSFKASTPENSSILSAESVALCLLKNFSEKQLPKASDLKWLVSEEDAPQQLLPLPNSWPVSPDDHNDDHKPTRIRGNKDWAPPRAQIIFNIHPSPNRSIMIAKQNYRCAGCGMKTEKSYIKRFRYCEYLGKYFCQCCHSNSLSVIPGKMLRKWDFKKYHVSKFSNDLLQKMWYDPLFSVIDINPELYRKAKKLESMKNLRNKLFLLKDFVRTCRLCEKLQTEYSSFPTHHINEPHHYSINDLLQVQNSDWNSKASVLVNDSLKHIGTCPLCQAKGFICEFCRNNSNILFPFQNGVTRCPDCCSCFHSSCYAPNKCPKCARIEARKIRENEEWTDDSSECTNS